MKDPNVNRIKKKLRKFAVTGMAIVLFVCTLAGCSNASGEEPQKAADGSTQVAEEISYTPKEYVDADQPDQSEVVYVTAGADGSVKEVKVETVLKNPGGLEPIRDYSELTGIRNLNGDEEYTKEGDVITWENHGEDITYKGEAKKELPVRLAVSYQLDGNTIAAKDLIGKSGHVKLRFDYTNLTEETVAGKEENEAVMIPFICITAVPMETEKFRNIHVENGDVMSMGDSKFAVGFAAPGLQEALGLEKLRVTEELTIPSYVEIEADVTDFELSFTETIVLHGLFEEMDEEQLGESEDSTKELQQLSKAAGRLTKGADQLGDGLEEYQKGLLSYFDGVEALKEGSKELESGMEELTRQGDTLVAGMKEYHRGVVQLNASLTELDSIKSLLPESLRTPLEELQQGVQALEDGSRRLKKGVIAYTEGTALAYEGTKQLKEGVFELTGAQDDLKDGLEAIAAGMGEFRKGLKKFSKKGIKELTTTLGDELMGVVDRAKLLKEADSRYESYAGIREGASGTVIFMIETEELLPKEDGE